MMRRLALALLLTLGAYSVQAEWDYNLQPRQIAADTWVLEGRLEDFSFSNGGNIVNTAFIATPAGVVVIDSGPSRRYGEQFAAAIRKITDKPVVKVFLTHHHPDHFLGNQAFPPAALAALPGTIAGLKAEGGAFTDNMYRLNGDWMRDTEMVVPTTAVAPGIQDIGGHRLELLALEGHTGADLAVFDHSTGVLFGGDLVFYQRAPTTPHARIGLWIASLDRLAALPFKQVVPGHGPVAQDAAPLAQTKASLAWLQRSMAEGAAAGLDMTEMLGRPLPAEFQPLAVEPEEYRRSVSHLYPAAEQAALETHGAR